MQKWIKIIFLINALGQSLALAVWQHLGCAGLGWLGWAELGWGPSAICLGNTEHHNNSVNIA